MSIHDLDLTTFQQTFEVSPADKLEYGEIYTPFVLIHQMLDLFDPVVFMQPHKRWLDIGAGRGYFSLVLFDRLNKGLATILPDTASRQEHILCHMLFLVELKDTNVAFLRELFGPTANILHADFCSVTTLLPEMDYVIGNPPYNSHGMKKVPTNQTQKKKEDGETVWIKFIMKSLTLLKAETGQLCVIIPSLWLKPDKANLHSLLTAYQIQKIHCLSGNQTNKLFKGAAQTPTCFFLLTKTGGDAVGGGDAGGSGVAEITLYDLNRQAYIALPHQIGQPIPLFGAAIIKKLAPWLLVSSSLKVVKTNMPSVKSKFTENLYSPEYPYRNITTCILENLQPVLLINFSNIPQAFYGEKKLVLAHKMYGFPYFDETGSYGISNRDNYVITGKTAEEFCQLKAFLSTKLVLYLYEAARYRMKYLEKYAFQFIPDITRLPGFPRAEELNDTTVADFFGLDLLDRQHIQNLHKKTYKTF
jgi:tRNA1(Val) A37 N6-methylase TrmN6